MRNNIDQQIELNYHEAYAHSIKRNKSPFFQIVYVVSGNGHINMNKNRTVYKEGSLLLFTPNDSYEFDVLNQSEFLYIKINSSYVRDYRWMQLDCMECLLHYAPKVSGCVMKSESDIILIRKIIDVILGELRDKKEYNIDLFMHLVNAIIVIAARNIIQIKPKHMKSTADIKFGNIIHYIHKNILLPDKLKASEIAGHFGISPNYLGSYFKRNCDETMQEYISNYRLRLIEHRLKFSDMRIGEIAGEFGFTDESHLNIFFKKHKHMNLSNFRKEHVLTSSMDI